MSFLVFKAGPDAVDLQILRETGFDLLLTNLAGEHLVDNSGNMIVGNVT